MPRPIPTDATTVNTKFPIIVRAISPPSIGLSPILSNIPPKITLVLPTTLNKIIATASFTIPSPKIIENSLGNWAESIRVSAATESVAEIVALNLTISPA